MGFFFDFTIFLNSITPIILWLAMLIFCFFSILFFLKLFGYIGIYIYTTIAIIAGNIQVLKTVDFFYSPEPVALGTILFASTFLCTDILSEHFGKEKAKTNDGILGRSNSSESFCTTSQQFKSRKHTNRYKNQ